MSFHQVRLSMKSVVLVAAVMASSAIALSTPVAAEDMSVSAVATTAIPSIARVIAVSTNAGELNDALAFLADETQLKLYFVRISQQWLDNDSDAPLRASDYKLYFANFDIDETVAIAPWLLPTGKKS